MSKNRSADNKRGAKHYEPRYTDAAVRKPVNKPQEPEMPKQNKLILWMSVFILGVCLLFPDLLAFLKPTAGLVLRVACIVGVVLAIVATYRGKYAPEYDVDERPITKFVPAVFRNILKPRDDAGGYEWSDECDSDYELYDDEEEEVEPAPVFVSAPQPNRRRPVQNPVAAPIVTAIAAPKKCECGAELSEKAKFCMECGKAVPQKHVCACGAELPEKAKFCMECGKPVASGTRPNPKPAGGKPEGGKK